MSTRSSIKYCRPDTENAPGYHLFEDCFEALLPDAPVYLQLFHVDGELSTDGFVQVTLPRQMARELGLLNQAHATDLLAELLACHDDEPLPEARGRVEWVERWRGLWERAALLIGPPGVEDTK